MLLNAQRLGVRPLARAVGCDTSTISRELKRNERDGGKLPYLATVGQARADRQPARSKEHMPAESPMLVDYVAGMLTLRERLFRSRPAHVYGSISRMMYPCEQAQRRSIAASTFRGAVGSARAWIPICFPANPTGQL